jgi:hypothetical protein
MPINPALGKLRQEDWQFEVSLKTNTHTNRNKGKKTHKKQTEMAQLEKYK